MQELLASLEPAMVCADAAVRGLAMRCPLQGVGFQPKAGVAWRARL